MATDISDKSWDDLYDTDYSILRELASEIDSLDGNAGREEICVGLLEYHGRADEIPEEYQENGSDAHEKSNDTEGEAEAETKVVEPDEEVQGSESKGSDEEDGEEDAEFQTANEYQPQRDTQFIIDGGPLNEWLGHINSLVDEATVHLGSDAIWTRAVDPAGVGMVDARLDRAAFDSYDVPAKGQGVIGINTKRLADVVGDADGDESVHLTYDSTTRRLVVKRGGHEFNLGTIDPESIQDEPDLPDLDLPAEIETLAATLKTAIGYAGDVSDHVSFSVSPEGKVYVGAKGDTDSYEGVFDDVRALKRPGERVRSLFSEDYLSDIADAIDKKYDVRLQIGQEFPLRLSSQIGEEDQGTVEYMLAPRIQSS